MAFDGTGVFAAVATPLDTAGCVDVARLAEHSADLMRRGLHGIALFGTTGEAPSFSVDERRAALEGMLASGIAAERVIVGTGAAALPDAIALTRHALALGCTRVLLVPPFYFKGATSAGVADAIGAVVDAVDDPRLRVVLYHIPQVSGVAFDDASIGALRARYGDVIEGIKDSSGHLAHSLGLIDRHPGLNVYVGAEQTIGRARAAGGAGAICGLANIVPEAVRASFDTASDDTHGVIADLVAAIDGQQFVPCLKGWLAVSRRHDGWRRVRAPLVAADPRASLPAGLAAALAA